MDKKLIKDRFSANFKTYDENAIAQKIIIENLTKIIPYQAYGNVLEIGSGSGLLSKKLDYLNAKKLFLNDLCEETKKYSNIKNLPHEYIIGDIEKIDFSEKFDLIVSSSVFQWINDLDKLFEKIASILNNHGKLIFSTFTVGNCQEIASIFNTSLDYKTEEDIKNILIKNFSIQTSKTANIPIFFQDVKSILTHIKMTGANAISGSKLTKTQLEQAYQQYEQFRTEQGLPLTYVASYFSVEKKEI